MGVSGSAGKSELAGRMEAEAEPELEFAAPGPGLPVVIKTSDSMAMELIPSTVYLNALYKK